MNGPAIESLCTCPPEGCGDCEVHVSCDSGCGALKIPLDVAELHAAYVHWRHHSNLGGCSHSR